MKVLDLDGSAFDRGRRQGQLVRKEFRKMLKDFFASDVWSDNKPPFLPKMLVLPALGLLGSLCIKKTIIKNMPLQAERVRGLAKGLGVRENVAWGLQFMEILMCEAGKSIEIPGGCTQVHAAPEATAYNRPLSGRNYDFPNVLLPYQVVRRELPEEPGRYAATTVSQLPLCGAHQGINEHGLMISVNNSRLLKGKDLRFKGVPYQILLMEALETCRNTDEAVNYLSKFPYRANAGFFGIVDAEGKVRVIEFTASRFTVRKPEEKGIMAQTNHYIQMPEANLPEGTVFTVKGMEGMEFSFSTKNRYNAALKRLKDEAGGITVESLMEILKDHSANDGEGCDFTVCCHGETGSTLSSMVVDPAERKIWIATGPPCSNQYQLIEFREESCGGIDYLQLLKYLLIFMAGSYNIFKALRGIKNI